VLEQSGLSSLLRCPTCDAQVWEPRTSPGGEWYDNDAHYIGFAVVDWLGWYQGTGLRSLPSDTQTLLDVGCADGRFVYTAARERGIDARGIDFSERLIRLGNERYSGDRLRHLTIEQYLARREPPVDAVTLFEVIEHVEEPLAFLRSSLRAARPGGTVVISTPNRHGFPHPPKGYDEPPHHLTRWSVRALANLATAAGITEFQITVCPADIAIKAWILANLRLGIVARILRRSSRAAAGDRAAELRVLRQSRVRTLIRLKDVVAGIAAKMAAPIFGRHFPGPAMILVGRTPGGHQ
jgi:2-polyprenyl-3-methyl-5-hydroxy-6-metoxy-1,4-benzoquinol methylase